MKIDWYEPYRKALERNENIRTGSEYLEEYATSTYEDLQSDPQMSELVEELPLSAFSRMNRPRNQDIAFVLANPKLSSNIADEGVDNHLFDFIDVDPNTEEFFEESEEAMRNWFLKNLPEVEGVLRQIAEYGLLQLPSSESSIQDYVLDNDGFVKDIYYTNWFKFATRKAPHIKKDYYSVANEVLSEELKAIDPTVTFVLGGKAWRRFAKGQVGALDSESEVATFLKNTSEQYWSPEIGWIVPTYHISSINGSPAGGLPDSLDLTPKT